MRNPLDTAATFFRSLFPAPEADRVPAPERSEELRKALTDLHAETWRLRDALDARLAALEKQLEESASRYETSILEIETAAAQVKETCRGFAESLDIQYAAAEKAIESLREAHDRRLRHLEQSHRTELATMALQHETALRGHVEARKSLAERVQSLAEKASLDLASALESNADGAINLTPIQRLVEKLQPRRRVRRLEETLFRCERQIVELGREACADGAGEARDELISVSMKRRLPLNGNGNNPGNGNGHGHDDPELDFALGGLERS